MIRLTDEEVTHVRAMLAACDAMGERTANFSLHHVDLDQIEELIDGRTYRRWWMEVPTLGVATDAIQCPVASFFGESHPLPATEATTNEGETP